VWAETAARIVADDIAARLTDHDPPSPFEGDGTCYIEFGGGRVARIRANFLGRTDANGPRRRTVNQAGGRKAGV
jgi:sulfide:quinone oxidoreductase